MKTGTQKERRLVEFRSPFELLFSDFLLNQRMKTGTQKKSLTKPCTKTEKKSIILLQICICFGVATEEHGKGRGGGGGNVDFGETSEIEKKKKKKDHIVRLKTIK